MGGIYDEVQNHLIKLAGLTSDPRQRWIEFGFQFCHILPLVARHRKSAFNRVVQVQLGFVLGARMREFLHSPDNFGDPGYTLERLVDGFGNFLK